MNYFVFILAGKDSEPLHVGITDDLMKGIYEFNQSSSADNGKDLRKLLHYEVFNDVDKARTRKADLEKSILNRTN